MAHYYHKIYSPWERTDVKSKTVNTEVFSDEYVEMLQNINWIRTEKVDGMNVNLYYDGNHIQFLGHTDKTQFDKEVKDFLDSLITPEREQILEQIFGEKEVFICGELIGPKIQNNLYNLKEYRFYVFDVFCKTTDTYWDFKYVKDIAEKLGFYLVPYLLVGTLGETKNWCISIPAPCSSISENIEIEGIVIKPEHELKKANGERIIYKVKICDLLGRKPMKIKE